MVVPETFQVHFLHGNNVQRICKPNPSVGATADLVSGKRMAAHASSPRLCAILLGIIPLSSMLENLATNERFRAALKPAILAVKVWPNQIRPKHHHRLHLSDQYIATGCMPSCWGPESKHRDYKSLFASTAVD